MNWRTWIPLVLALALGLTAAKVGHDIVVRNRNAGVSGGRFAKVVVAARDVEPGRCLTERDLKLGTVAAEDVPRNSFPNPSNLVGRVVMVPLVKHQPVLEGLLAPTGSAGGPQALIPSGMRAVSLEINEASGVAGLIGPGCRVDVMSTLQGEGNQATTRTIVENVKVLAVGQKIIPGSGSEEPQTGAKSATLLVNPQQAESLELASHSGRTRLVLRGSTDESTGKAGGITVAELIGRSKPAPVEAVAMTAPRPVAVTPVKAVQAAPAKKTVNRRTIEVISGTEITQVQVEVPLGAPAEALTGNDGAMERAIPGNDAP